jgi:Ribbon-helix-helix protein, copG family
MLYADLMKRTTIMLPEDLDARVRIEARRRGVSIADIAREAIERYIGPSAPSGKLAFFAVGKGGPPDASERVDEFVGKAIARRRRPRRSD